MTRVSYMWIFAVVMLSSQALADQILLKNGDRLTGVIARSDGKTLTIQAEYAGPVTVPLDAVDQISSNQPLYLTLKDNQVIVGTVASTADKVEVRTRDTGTVTVSRDAIQSVRSQAEHAAYEAALDRLRNPGVLDLWRGSADMGLSLTRGNAKTTTFNVGMNAARTTPRDKIGVYVTSLYAKNSTTGTSLTTANAIRGGARYDVNITNRHFAFGLGDLEFDEFQRLDLRLVLGGGLGWHLRKTEQMTLDLFGGAAVNKEYFSTGLKRTSGELLLGQELNHKFSSRTSLRERLVLLPNLSDRGEFRLTFDLSAITNLNSWLGWQVTVSDRYLSNPVLGAKANDVLLTTGLHVTFGR